MHILRAYDPYCLSIDFSRNGLIAAIEQANKDAMYELVIYETPGGKVRDRFPLVNCVAEIKCSFDVLGRRWRVAWSPNGRYLAFPAIWGDEPSQDLYLYDSQDHTTRKLVGGPAGVAELSWSPDGKWIIMGEVTPATDQNAGYEQTTSVLAVSLDSGETHLLYTSSPPYMPQDIFGWLDDQRFLAVDYDTPYSYNLRLVNLSGETQLLFDGSFGRIRFDRAREVAAIVVTQDGKHAEGTYLISLKDLTVNFIGADQYDWDDNLSMFVAYGDFLCKDDDKKIKTLTTDGKVACVLPPAKVIPSPPEHSPAPDGSWQVVWQKGILLLQAPDQTTRYITNAPVTQLIWRQDLSCFFYIANQVLYRVSMSDLTIQPIDEALKKDEIIYQWLNARN